jgi:hypothetical protein
MDHQQEQSFSYSSTNLPPSREEGHRRLEECNSSVERIQTDLDLKKQLDFPNEKEFLDWRRRAIRSCGHYKTEIKFLRQWLSVATTARPVTLNQQEESLVKRFVEIADGLKKRYTTHFTNDNPPSTQDEVTARRNEISPLLDEFSTIFKETRSLADSCGISAKRYDEFRRPIMEVYDAARTEAQLLNKHARKQQSVKDRHQVDWTLFLVSLLDRAISTGFALSDEERELLEKIRTTRLTKLAS